MSSSRHGGSEELCGDRMCPTGTNESMIMMMIPLAETLPLDSKDEYNYRRTIAQSALGISTSLIVICRRFFLTKMAFDTVK